MADRSFSIDVKIEGESAGFQAMMKELVKEVRGLRTDVGELSVALKETATTLRDEAQAFARVATQTALAAVAIRDLTGAQERGAVAAEAEKQAIDEIGDAAVRTAAKIEALNRARPDVQRQLSIFGGSMKPTDVGVPKDQQLSILSTTANFDDLQTSMREAGYQSVTFGEQLHLLDDETQSVADSVAHLGEQLSVFGVATTHVGHELGGFKEQLREAGYQTATLGEQLRLLDDDTLSLASATARAGEQLSVFGIASDHAKAAVDELSNAEVTGIAAADGYAAALREQGAAAEEAAVKMAMLRAADDGGGGPSALAMAGHLFTGNGGGRRRFIRGLGPLGALGLIGGGGLSVAHAVGLGPEHVIGAGLSLGVSAAQAGLGGGALGLGMLGQFAVGGGSDMAVMKSTISDTKTLFDAYTNLQKAISIYGAHTRQASLAQAQLNYQMQQLGPAAGAELGLAKAVDQLNTMWDKLSAAARVQAVKILDQVVGLGKRFLPLVTDAAKRNLGIIDTALKPLFAWLEGPQGIKIFHDLENAFARNLPVAVHAFSQALEVVLKIMDVASARTGGLTRILDRFFTRINSESPGVFATHINHLIDRFDAWMHMIHLVGSDLLLLFRSGAQEGNTLVATFTHWLQKFHDWETSVAGSAFLHTFFANRQQELVAILHIIPPIARAFGGVYASVQPLVPVVTLLANLFAGILHTIEKLNPAMGTAVAGLLVAGKILGFGTVATKLGIKGAAPAIGGAAVGTAEAAGAGAVAAAALRSDVGQSIGGLSGSVGGMLGGGVFAGIAAGLKKAAPLLRVLKVGAALWIGSGIIDGISTALNGDVWKYAIRPNPKAAVNALFGPNLGNEIQKVAMAGVSGIEKAATDVGAGPLVGFFEKVMGQTSSVTQRIQAMKNQIAGLGTSLNQAFAKGSWRDVDRITNSLQQLANRGISALNPTIARIRDMQATLAGLSNTTPGQVQKIWESFQNARNLTGSAIENMRGIVSTNMQTIEMDVGTHSANAKHLLAFNFKAAADYMALNYQAMGVSTEKAMQFISQEFIAALTTLGVQKGDFKGVKLNAGTAAFLRGELATVSSLGAGALNDSGATLNHRGLAQGGIVGNPNAAGRDQYHVVVGEGEAVVTRHQRSVIDRALPRGMSVANVVSSVTTPHYAAQGFVAGMTNYAGTGGLGQPGNNSAGGYIFPFGAGLSYGRVDEGLDMAGAGDIATIGRAQFTRVSGQGSGTGWPGAAGKGTGSMIVYQLLDGPRRGAYVYTSENIDPKGGVNQGTVLPAGTVFAHARGFYPFLEEGWSDAGGTPLAHSIYTEGMITPQGSDFSNFIHGLQHGQLIGGGGNFLAGGGGSLPPLPIPKLKMPTMGGTGLTDALARGAAAKYLAAAQSYLNKKGQQINASRTGGSAMGGGGAVGMPVGGNWFRVGATVDNTGGQTGDSNMTFAELLIAGHNQGLGQDLTELLGYPAVPRGASKPAMPFGSAVLVRMPGGRQAFRITKNDVGSGQPGDPHYKVDLHPGIAGALGWHPNQDIEVHKAMRGFLAAQGLDTAHIAASHHHKVTAHRPPSSHIHQRGKTKLPKTHARKPPKLKGVKRIPRAPGLTDGFQYLFDQKAVVPNPLDGSFKLKNYLGGNSAAIDRATGTEWQYLTGLMDLVDDTDPVSGAPVQNPAFAYGPGAWWQGSPGNADGFATVWKDDQELAARLGILKMENVELYGAGAESGRLGKYVHTTKGDLNKLADRAVVEQNDISKWTAAERFVRLRKSREDFAKERLRVRQAYQHAIADLTIKRLRKNLSLDTLYNTAHHIMEDEKRRELAVLEGSAQTNIKLDPMTVQLERNQIDADFAGRLTGLTQLRQKLRTHGAIDAVKARLFLQTVEGDSLYAIGRREHGYTQAGVELSELVSTTRGTLSAEKGKAKIVATDLLAADQSAISGKLAAKMLKLGVDTSQIFGPQLSGGAGDIKSEIASRISQLTDDTRFEKNVTIAGLLKQRNAVSGQNASVSTTDNATLLTLSQQAAQYAAIDNAVMRQQLQALAGFTPILGQMVGSFAKGGPITSTGMALVHRGEYIVPDPQGPYGHMSAPAQGAGGGPSHVEVNLHGSLAVLEPFVEVLVDKVAQRVVSQQTGRRTRILSGAPGNR